MPSPTSHSGASAPPGANPIQVMLVDDSAVVRGFIGRILESDPDIKVVASVANGEQGILSARRYHPDIVILDIEMPVMDGITALPKIIEASPGVKILMCSTLTERNAEITMKAFQLGAADTIAKPSNSVSINAAEDFKLEIVRKVKSIGRRANALRGPAAPERPLGGGVFSGGRNAPLKNKTPFELRRHRSGEIFRPSLLAIGSSTGGPQALFKVLSHFEGLDAPIVITQHMPPTFTRILAQHITQQTGIPAQEGETGMKVESNNIYIAPGGHHMTFARKDGAVEIVLNDGPPENFCKPSVDPMLRSALDIWGGKILTVILTGMGSDGLPGARLVAQQGGRVIAQDQETSVVWGMPGAVATNGLCTAVLPLLEIGPYVRQTFGKP